MPVNIEECLQIKVWSIIQMTTTTYKNRKIQEKFPIQTKGFLVIV